MPAGGERCPCSLQVEPLTPAQGDRTGRVAPGRSLPAGGRRRPGGSGGTWRRVPGRLHGEPVPWLRDLDGDPRLLDGGAVVRGAGEHASRPAGGRPLAVPVVGVGRCRPCRGWIGCRVVLWVRVRPLSISRHAVGGWRAQGQRCLRERPSPELLAPDPGQARPRGGVAPVNTAPQPLGDISDRQWRDHNLDLGRLRSGDAGSTARRRAGAPRTRAIEKHAAPPAAPTPSL